MRRAFELVRPDLIRARAVLGAMRNASGKQIRTVAQAVVWIDKHHPELTDAWLSWVDEKSGGDPNRKNPPPLLA